MKRRNKPSFQGETSNPERATRNLFTRDMLLARQVKAQAQARDLTVYEVDGSRSAEEMATLIEQHFEPFPCGAAARSTGRDVWYNVYGLERTK